MSMKQLIDIGLRELLDRRYLVVLSPEGLPNEATRTKEDQIRNHPVAEPRNRYVFSNMCYSFSTFFVSLDVFIRSSRVHIFL